MADEPQPHPILDSPAPHASAAVMLHLSWLRSAVVVGLGLLAAHPTSDEWAAAMDDPEFQAEIAAYAGVMRDIRLRLKVGDEMDLEALQGAADPHYGRALESLALTAERLEIPADDLLAVLVHA
jgi:hypothetical protein